MAETTKVIPFIEGDGIGPEVWASTRLVLESAVARAYRGGKKIEWREIFAGEKAFQKTGEWLPQATLKAIEEYGTAIKGPLTTPVGGGIRSINVTLRQTLDLYSCIRPVRYFEGVPSPMLNPHELDVVIFRENTEDVYAGIEWAAGTKEADKVRAFLAKEMGARLRKESSIGIKPMSAFGSRRLIRMALKFARTHERPTVTLVHKGNIMKYTEGAFRNWGYELAEKEFGEITFTEEELRKKYQGKHPKGKILVNDRIADAMFQLILLHPSDYSVIATSNLNGDYLSDACAAQVGGLGMAPGANIGDKTALFEATHGTAPDIAGKDKANPTSLILSGVMMLEHLGWQAAAKLVIKGIEKTILQKTVTEDLALKMQEARMMGCSEYGEQIVKNMG
ncbi:MAG: isocitrate dehydrogenase (NADP(+)) [Deltaproteobacteria bacterium]|nr:isocitrate dehydrogenase (NADP(+)) [Deltaproteobacteria bacterium]